MKLFKLSMLCVAAIGLCASCERSTAEEIQLVDSRDGEGQPQLTFNNGYTNLTVYNYHIKITAEQRMGDNLVQVVAMPTESGVQFQILNVRFGQMPESANMGGPAAIVQGVVHLRTSELNATRVTEIVPVQINSVTDFSISPDTARMQGYQCVQRQMPNMQSN